MGKSGNVHFLYSLCLCKICDFAYLQILQICIFANPQNLQILRSICAVSGFREHAEPRASKCPFTQGNYVSSCLCKRVFRLHRALQCLCKRVTARTLGACGATNRCTRIVTSMRVPVCTRQRCSVACANA